MLDFTRMARALAIVALGLLLAPGTSLGAGLLVFKPSSLPAGKVGARYQVVIHVSQGGHHPALGKDSPSYTVTCFGADPTGGFIDDCKKLPPGLTLKDFTGPTCAPPLQRPACIVLAGIPRKAGVYTFRLSAPNLSSPAVRGILYKYTLVVRR
jgi:hypothetical protein